MEQNLSKSEQERLARISGAKKRKLKKLIIWLVVLAAIAGASWWIIDYSRKAESRKPGEAIPEMGRTHIADGAEHEPYNSNPPTSGPHYAAPAGAGFYETQIPDETLIHNLEHGHVWISYRDPGDAELKEKLKKLSQDNPWKLIITPRPENDSAIALAAWGRLLKLEIFDEKQINSFLKAFIDKGPEKTPF